MVILNIVLLGDKMKKVLIVLIMVVAVLLTACSVSDFLPSSGNETDESLNDTFELVDTNATDDIAENSTEISEEDEMVFTSYTATEGDLISLRELYAIDPDGDYVSYEYTEPFNDAGLWQTNDGDEGKYLTSISATDGLLSTTEEIQIILLPSNKAPVITCETEYTFAEGDLIQLPCIIYDKEGDEVTQTVSGFMDDLSYQTDFDDAGEHLVVISATDGNKVSTLEVDITIENVNRAPVLSSESLIFLENINATELETVELNVEVSDPDGDALTIEYPEMFDDEGIWVPQRGEAGIYNETVVVSDGNEDIEFSLFMLINKVNLPPTFEIIPALTFYEGDFISLPVNITDDEEVVVTYEGFPGMRTYQTDYDDAGEYETLITAYDGTHYVSQTVQITILNVNRPPVFIDE